MEKLSFKVVVLPQILLKIKIFSHSIPCQNFIYFLVQQKIDYYWIFFKIIGQNNSILKIYKINHLCKILKNLILNGLREIKKKKVNWALKVTVRLNRCGQFGMELKYNYKASSTYWL